MPEAKLPFERPRVLTAMVASAAAVQVARGSKSVLARRPGARRAASPRSPRRCSLCGATTSLRTTAQSTSRSAARARRGARRRSTSAAARTCSARCSRLSPSATCSPRARPCTSARPARRSPRWARSPPRPRSSPGWCGTPRTRSRRRSPSRVTSSSIAWRPRSRPRAARSRRGRARGVPGARAWQSGLGKSGYRPRSSTCPVEKMREGYYTDAYFNHARETLLADGRRPRVVMQVFQRKRRGARWDRRGDRDPQALLARLGGTDRPRASTTAPTSRPGRR